MLGVFTGGANWARCEFMILAFLCREIPFIVYYAIYNLMQKNRKHDIHRIQGNRSPDASLVSKAISKALIDHLVVQVPVLWFSFDLFVYIGSPQIHDPLPPLHYILIQGVFFIFICDMLGYWTHRLMHHPKLYALFHKQHHEFHTNHPIASSYFGTVDDLLTGVLPTIAGPVLLKSHVVITFVWVALRICETTEAHFGYSRILPFNPPFATLLQPLRPSDWHDFHHSHNKGNYGTFFTFWDNVCGTDVGYYEHHKSRTKK